MIPYYIRASYLCIDYTPINATIADFLALSVCANSQEPPSQMRSKICIFTEKCVNFNPLSNER